MLSFNILKETFCLNSFFICLNKGQLSNKNCNTTPNILTLYYHIHNNYILFFKKERKENHASKNTKQYENLRLKIVMYSHIIYDKI